MSRFRLSCSVAALFSISACGDDGANVVMPDPELPPSWDALATMPSETGAWEIVVWTWPQPPVKGVDDVVFRVTDPTGAAAVGVELHVLPWMPVHAHGTTLPVVMSKGDGYFLVKSVYLYMSGEWQMRTTLGGSTRDSVTPVVEIP